MSGIKNLSRYWYDKNFVALALLPLSWLFRLLAMLRRAAYKQGLLKVWQAPMPIIVVGNITVGGSGKTPLVIWLAEFLKHNGRLPGIISRGYGGTANSFPQQVYANSDPYVVGDEPVLMAQRTGCPIVIDPDRARAARALIDRCDVLISDDGLQHHALGRTVEIAVIDAVRVFGNGYCLPAGPLREPPGRLRSVDFVVSNGALRATQLQVSIDIIVMNLVGHAIINLRDDTLARSPKDFKTGAVHAVAGIGNPKRFFAYLRSLGLEIIEHAFPDHHRFVREDLYFGDDLATIMTEKDAVKCRNFAQPKHWYLPVEAKLGENFGERLLGLLTRK
ncbi:MAG: tetraacyldisaccharide 4'-kinase [Gammaproteobacteria bacterium]